MAQHAIGWTRVFASRLSRSSPKIGFISSPRLHEAIFSIVNGGNRVAPPQQNVRFERVQGRVAINSNGAHARKDLG